MAGSSAKKAEKARQKTSSTLLPLVLGVDLLYVVVRLVLRSSTATRWHIGGFVVVNLIYGSTFAAAVDAATAPKGSLSEYFFDLFVVALASQAFAAVSDYGWLLLTVVPAFLLYKAFAGGDKKNKSDDDPPDDDPPDQAKKSKQKFKRTGRR